MVKSHLSAENLKTPTLNLILAYNNNPSKTAEKCQDIRNPFY